MIIEHYDLDKMAATPAIVCVAEDAGCEPEYIVLLVMQAMLTSIIPEQDHARQWAGERTMHRWMDEDTS